MVACSIGGPLTSDLEQAGVPLRCLTRRLVKRRLSLVYAWRLRRLVRRERFDLVHAHLYASVTAAALATLRTDVPLVVTEQTEAPWQAWFALQLSSWSHGRAVHVIAVSDAIARRLRERGVAAEKISVIRNAVPPPVAAVAVRSSIGRAPTVGVVARLVAEKGLDVLLDAALALRERVPGVRFVVAGDGPLRPALKARASRLELGANVEFLGFRDDVCQLLGSFDVLAVHSLAEGTPLSIVEAMWAGVPIVASAAGGIPEQIADERDGLLVARGDSAALSRALLRVLEDDELASRLRAAGRARARSEFSHEAMLDRILAVYARAGAPADRGSATEPLEPATV